MSDALCQGKLSVLSMARLEHLKRKDLLTSIYCLVEFLKILFQLHELDGFLTTGILVAGGGPSSINSSGSLQNNKITVQKRLKVHQRKSNGEGVGETGHQMMLWTESIGFNGSSNL